MTGHHAKISATTAQELAYEVRQDVQKEQLADLKESCQENKRV